MYAQVQKTVINVPNPAIYHLLIVNVHVVKAASLSALFCFILQSLHHQGSKAYNLIYLINLCMDVDAIAGNSAHFLIELNYKPTLVIDPPK